MDAFYDLGRNFIDTANVYQSGQSEQWIGEWLRETGRRDEMVISTKYTLGFMAGRPVQQSNFGEAGTKSLHVAIEASLITSVALAYALQKAPYVFPIVGGHNVANLKINVEALGLELSPEDIAEIETGYEFDLGFPSNFINMAGKPPRGPADASVLGHLGFFNYVQPAQAIKPHKGKPNMPWRISSIRSRHNWEGQPKESGCDR